MSHDCNGLVKGDRNVLRTAENAKAQVKTDISQGSVSER